MSNIEKVVKQALLTFSHRQSKIKFQENLSRLIQCVSKLKLNDVFLDQELIRLNSGGSSKENPVLYVEVFIDRNVLISIFILKSQSVLPLHDHPLMHGVLKVLSGSVHIQNYTVMNTNLKLRDMNGDNYAPNDYYYLENGKSLYNSAHIPVIKHNPVILSESDSCAVITPGENNIHEVRSINGPSAFIDVLAPPYNSPSPYIGPRKCTYFEVIGDGPSENTSTLRISNHSPNYWCVEIPFRGPKLKVPDDN